MKHPILLFAALLFLALPLAAQGTAPADDYFGGLHKKGSQLISLATGVEVPLFILPADPGATESAPLGVGASFSMSYQYFVANRISIGGALTGAFNGTVGGRTLFVAPISFRSAYWWGTAPMEYNAGIDLGVTVLRLSGNGMITPFAKLGAGIYRLVSEAWSVGGNMAWWLIPEIHTGTNAGLTRYANFLEISIGASYYF